MGLFRAAAIVVGGSYVFHRLKRKDTNNLIEHATGAVLGEKIGCAAGFTLAGPVGALGGSILGTVSGLALAKRLSDETPIEISQLDAKNAKTVGETTIKKATTSRRKASTEGHA